MASVQFEQWLFATFPVRSVPVKTLSMTEFPVAAQLIFEDSSGPPLFVLVSSMSEAATIPGVGQVFSQPPEPVPIRFFAWTPGLWVDNQAAKFVPGLAA